MSKSKSIITEYRPYNLPFTFPVLLLTGDRWRISHIKSERLHFHNCLEIGICQSECGYIDFAGTVLEFNAGDIVCIPKNLHHTTYSATPNQSLWSYIFLDTDILFQNICTNTALVSELTMVDFSRFQYILPKEMYPKIHFLATEAAKELSEKPLHYQVSTTTLLFSLCLEILRIQKQPNTIPEQLSGLQNGTALIITPALDYIEKNYMHQFPIEHLAEICHMSETHFRRVFQSVMSTSPLDFLNNIRIKKACALLKTTSESVLCISEQVGFRSISSFNRCFSKTMGSSPREWRKEALVTEGKSEKGSVVEYQGWIYPET